MNAKEDRKKQIVYKKVAELIPYENNPRNNDEAVEYVANSIKQFGFQVPCVIDKDNIVVAGHTRLKACKRLGIKEVPCIVADELTDDQIKAFRIADNKVGEVATWDNQKLAEELADIDLDMDMFGDFELNDEIVDLDSDDQEEDDRYTKKTNIPQYEITGKKPNISELYDLEKYNELIKDIEQADVSDEVKQFLKLSATRHIVFNYQNIAEYYAHADKEVQQLMEDSALVIIDYEDAIKDGFVRLSEDVIQMEAEDDEG